MAGIPKLLVAASFCLALVVGGTATAQEIRTGCLTGCMDNWLSFQRNTDNSDQWLYQPRFWFPFDLSGGWAFLQRVDLPVSYTNQFGADNTSGTWKAGIGDWFIEEIFSTPELAANFRMWASVRFVFPTGGASPFGSGQYQWAPAVHASYAMPEYGITFGPVARYYMSYHATQPGAAKIRQLNLYPILTFALPDSWSLAFYPENGIGYNGVTNKWFVPIDLMLTKRLTKGVEVAFGSAYGLIKDEPQYKYQIYGRVTFYF